MADTTENILQRMYQHQELKTKSGEEYVVRGARVVCDKGKDSCVLNLPVDHGAYTSDQIPLILVNDSGINNVKGFGYCNEKMQECVPDLDNWSNLESNIDKLYDVKSQRYQETVAKNAITRCRNGGGNVRFISSGQTIPDYPDGSMVKIEIKEDERGSWEREKEDFIGHFRAEHTGLYHLGVHARKPGEVISGSIFIYREDINYYKKVLFYEGVVVLREHKNGGQFRSEIYIDDTNEASFWEKWTTWADIILEGCTDYCFEIDCPGIDSFEYKLVGNMDKIINSNYVAVSWIIKDNFSKCINKESIRISGPKMVVCDLWLNYDYAMLLKIRLQDRNYQRKHPNQDIWKQMLKEGFHTGISIAIGTASGVVGNILAILGCLLDFSKNTEELILEELSKYENDNYTAYEDESMTCEWIGLSFFNTFKDTVPNYEIEFKRKKYKKEIIGYKYLIGNFYTITKKDEKEENKNEKTFDYNNVIKPLEQFENLDQWDRN